VPPEHVLALDAGTSSVRCALYRPGAADPVVVEKRPWVYGKAGTLGPFGRSFDADAFWALAAEAMRNALHMAALTGSDIAAVGVTSQRLAIVFVDAEGRPLAGMPNTDARALAEGLAIDRERAAQVYATTGKLPSLLLAPARVHWMRSREPEALTRTARILTLADWLAYRLTGVPASEGTLAADCGLLDVATRERNEDLLSALDFPLTLLAPLVTSSDVAGEITAGAARETGLEAGTPVIVAGGDSQCALVGMGIESPGEAGIASGWSCPLEVVTAAPRFDPRQRTWVNLHAVPDRWLVESSATDAGRVWEWWAGTLGTSLQEAARLVETSPPSSHNVLAFLGPGPMNAKAMGLHLGGVLMMTPLALESVGLPELLRSALENIAFAVRANLAQAEDVAGRRAERIAIGGGMTRIPAFSQLLADVFERPVAVAQDIEVTARGAAIAATRTAGLRAIEHAPLTDVYSIAEHAETYQHSFARWDSLRQTLDDKMQELL
jgi:autoinducer 2 (AI-2) kinase